MSVPPPRLQDFYRFSRGPLLSAGLGVIAMTLALVLAGLEFEDQILMMAQRVADLFGFAGLCVLAFIGDSIPSPIPPDLILVVIMKSHLQENWPVWVGIIAGVSMLGGHFGYWLGYHFSRFHWLPEKIKVWPQRFESEIRRFGPWAVVLGAVTPLPFSFTCISAGFLKLPYRSFSLAAASRVPRVIFFYLILSSSHFLKELWFT